MTVLRGNAGEVATLVGGRGGDRGVESVAAGEDASGLAHCAPRPAQGRGLRDGPGRPRLRRGERAVAITNGDPLLGAVSGTGCMSTAITGAFAAAEPGIRCKLLLPR